MAENEVPVAEPKPVVGEVVGSEAALVAPLTVEKFHEEVDSIFARARASGLDPEKLIVRVLARQTMSRAGSLVDRFFSALEAKQ